MQDLHGGVKRQTQPWAALAGAWAWLRQAAHLPSLCPICRRWNHAEGEHPQTAGWPLCRTCLASYAQPAMRCAHCALALMPQAASTAESASAPPSAFASTPRFALDRLEPLPTSPHPLRTPWRTCGACLREPPPWAWACCAVDYGFPWAHLIGAMKFQSQPELAKPFGRMLAAQLRSRALDDGQALADWVVPMPLSAARLAQRGYNQAWELTQHSARSLGLRAMAQGLHRSLDAPAQAGLSREQRARNLRAAFHVPPEARPVLKGCRVALVDDVLTTGATAREASLALLRAGVAQVQLWVFARTPEQLV